MRGLALMALLCVACDAGAAEVWEALSGSWNGKGEVRSMPAAVELEFRPALGGRARHLRFVSRMTRPDGEVWAFQAEAFYLCDAGTACRGHWYDNRGVILPLAASAGDDRLVVEWGDASTERGRTTYRLRGEDGLEIVDEIRDEGGAWRVFGRVVAARVAAAD